MENTEKVVRLLVGIECVDDRRETRIAMSAVLESLLKGETDTIYINAFSHFEVGQLQHFIKIVEAILLAYPHPKDWSYAFNRIIKYKMHIKEYPDRRKSEFFFAACIASMLAVCYLHTQKMLTKQGEEQFFNFLLDLRGGPMSWIDNADKSLSGTLSNVSGIIVSLPGATSFLKAIEHVTAPDGPSCLGEKQLIEELCIKRFASLSVGEKLRLCVSMAH